MAHSKPVSHLSLYGTPFADISEGCFSFVPSFAVISERLVPLRLKVFGVVASIVKVRVCVTLYG